LLMTSTLFDLALEVDMNDLDIKNVKEIVIGNQGGGLDASIFSNNAAGKEIFMDTDRLIMSRSGGSGQPHEMEFFRDDSTPNDDDKLGEIFFYGRDSAGNKEDYARIRVDIKDVTTTTEDGQMAIGVKRAGSIIDYLFINGETGLQVGPGTGTTVAFWGSTPVVQQSVGADTLANLYTLLRAIGIVA